MEVRTLKNHNNKLKTKRQKKTNKNKEKKQTNDKKNLPHQKMLWILPKKSSKLQLAKWESGEVG